MTFTINVIINLFDFFNVIVVAENKSIERDFVFEFIDKLRDIQTTVAISAIGEVNHNNWKICLALDVIDDFSI